MAGEPQVDKARTAEDIVMLMRDYVATLTPEQLGRLPERPTRSSPRTSSCTSCTPSLRITHIHRERAALSNDPFPDGL